MNTKLENARIEFEKSRAVYMALAEMDDLPSSDGLGLPSSWDTEWQPSFPEQSLRFPEQSLREKLISEASSKPIRKFAQVDIFQNFGMGDDCMQPDKDGDWICSGQTYELNNSHCLRVLIPSGATKEDTIRGLKKAIEIVRKNPVCSWDWGHIEDDHFGNFRVLEPEVGKPYADNTKLLPVMRALHTMTKDEIEEVIKGAKVTLKEM
jgi:hypothetical protein